jgi:hypothetical protein
MDELQLLREFRADEASEPARLERARAALIAEIETAGAGAGAAPADRTAPFPRRWAVLGAAGLALVAVLTAVFALPSDQGGPNQAGAALRRVALVAGDLPAESAPKRGQYLFTKSVRLIGPEPDHSPFGDPFEDSRVTFGEKAARAGVARYTVQLWAAPGDGRFHERRVTDRDGIFQFPGTPIDPQAREERWNQKPGLEACYDQFAFRGCQADPRGKIIDPFGARHTDAEAYIGMIDPNPLPGEIYKDLSGLPTEPEALREKLLEENRREAAVFLDTTYSGGSTVETFDIVSDLLSTPGNYASPEVRQALYEVVADLPDVDLVGEVKDPLGRRGLAVALTNNGIERQLIFDPNTSELLAREDVAADPGELGLDAKPGAVLSYTAYLVSGIADSLHERPSVNFLARSVPSGGP